MKKPTPLNASSAVDCCFFPLFLLLPLLKGIEYNSSTKGKCENTKEIGTTGSTENCESEKLNTEVENDRKVSFNNVTNVG